MALASKDTLFYLSAAGVHSDRYASTARRLKPKPPPIGCRTSTERSEATTGQAIRFVIVPSQRCLAHRGRAMSQPQGRHSGKMVLRSVSTQKPEGRPQFHHPLGPCPRAGSLCRAAACRRQSPSPRRLPLSCRCSCSRR